MPPTGQIIDALWQCFCPRFSVTAYSTPATRPITHAITSQSSRKCRLRTHERRYHQTRFLKSINHIEQVQLDNATNPVNNGSSSHPSGGKVKSVLYEELAKCSNQSNEGNLLHLWEKVRHLVEDRKDTPNSRLYTALLLGNTDPRYGSSLEVERILQEMEDEGIPPDSIHYHAALKVLSIHPDYLFRNEILDRMQQKWFSLTVDGWHDVVVGLLRDRQIERAIDKLDRMQEEGMEIQAWLLDLLVYTLCDIEEFDQVLAIMRARFNQGELEISGTLWAYILDTASRSFHHELTLYAWRTRVANDYLSPSSGVCINVLDLAARHGNYSLATDVFRVLGKRSSTLKLYHYEALLESYMNADDLRTSLTIPSIMLAAGIQPEEGSTRPIYLYLCKYPPKIREALSILRELHEGQRQIPTVAVNCIIEAAVHQGEFVFALETYQILHTISPAGPTTTTFNALFHGCANEHRKDIAMFLASEMLALKVVPDALTYDWLIRVCLICKELDDGLRYFEETKRKGWWPRRGTLAAIIKRTCEAGDERVFDLLDDMERGGVDVVGFRRWVRERWEHMMQGKEKGEKWERVMEANELASKHNVNARHILPRPRP